MKSIIENGQAGGVNDSGGMQPLVKIGARAESGVSRRDFLKISGAGVSALALAGCADSNEQKIFPNLKGDYEEVPGVSVWYSSTCTECSAGCGIQVKTRNGRATKIEGNPDSPVNRGSLCALGHAALQHLYDPDRVRQPMKRVQDNSGAYTLQPIAWKDAIAEVTEALKGAKGTKAFITGAQSGTVADVVQDFSGAFGVEHAVLDITEQGALAKATELVFGQYGVPTFELNKAKVIVNFGADFLETWVSPCEFAREWAQGRNPESPAKFFHIEPRLSLTGANADSWLNCNPNAELVVATSLLKQLLELGRSAKLSGEALALAKKITAGSSVAAAATRSGISTEKLLLIAQELHEAPQSVVLAGGTAAGSADAVQLFVVVHLINVCLGNVGATVKISGLKKPTSNPVAIKKLLDTMEKGKVDVLLVHGANPVYHARKALGFDEIALKKVPFIVSFSSHLDETTEFADIILPASHALESWGDVDIRPGVYGLQQPVMFPVFDTKAFGDILISLATTAGKSDKVAAGAADMLAAVRASWQKIYEKKGSGEGFEVFWKKSVERGGVFEFTPSNGDAAVVATADVAKLFAKESTAPQGLTLYPFASVKSFDGRAANRPWLQELPDPITQLVWESWAEIHPDTAAAAGLKQGDTVVVRTEHGEQQFPVYLTPYVNKQVVAVPMGQGHVSYGRYARVVGYGNVFDLIPPTSLETLQKNGGSFPTLVSGVTVVRGLTAGKLVGVQGSDSQLGRDLAKTKFLQAGEHGAHEDHHGGGHHEPKQMYVQREHPMHKWGLAIDLNACTGCGACVVACNAENNIPVVGKKQVSQGREMSWLRIERYYDQTPSQELSVSFLPMMCQHCQNAPCEPVCPVFATYHNDEGLNVMVYNRCVGTRYCSNNCSYKVRRFNWVETSFPSPLDWQLNPDVTKRTSGVMEKCTFCVHKISEAKDMAKDEGREIRDGEIKPACVQSCPSQAIVFGDFNDPNSRVSTWARSPRAYKVLDHHINTQPSVVYLERVKHSV